MVAIIIACLLVAVLTYYQMHTQGFFSSIIMAGDCLIALMLAFNYYEMLSAKLIDLGLGLYGPQTIALMGIFIISLIILRLITDKLVSGNMNFPPLVDRIGALMFGFVSSMIVVGVIFLGLQHLALPAKLLGFDRCPELENSLNDKTLIPAADNFVVSMVNITSAYGFSGQNNFAQNHPEFLRELYLNRLVPKNHEGSRRESSKDSIVSLKPWIVKKPVRNLNTGEMIKPKGEFLAVRLELKASNSKENPGAGDVDGNVRVALGSFRAVGFSQDNEVVSQYPVGFLKPGGTVVDQVSLESGKILTGKNNKIELLFDWDKKLKQIPPKYIEFKRSAKKDFPDVSSYSNLEIIDSDEIVGLTAVTASMKFPAETISKVVFSELFVVSQTDPTTIQKLMIPAPSVLEKSTTDLDGREGEYYMAHTSILKMGGNDTDSTSLPLVVPDGYYLYAVTGVSNRSGVEAGRFMSPILVDTNDKSYPSVGFSLRGNIAESSIAEFAYNAYDLEGNLLENNKMPGRFPKQIKSLKKKAEIQKITYYFLVPKTKNFVGILGVKLMKNRTMSEFWGYEDNVDIVVPTSF